MTVHVPSRLTGPLSWAQRSITRLESGQGESKVTERVNGIHFDRGIQTMRHLDHDHHDHTHWGLAGGGASQMNWRSWTRCFLQGSRGYCQWRQNLLYQAGEDHNS